MKNGRLTDEYLLTLASQGNQDAFDELFKRYKTYGEQLITNYLQDKHIFGLTKDDFVTCTYMAFDKSINDVNFQKGDSLYPIFRIWCLSYFSDLLEEEIKFNVGSNPKNNTPLDSTYNEDDNDIMISEVVGTDDSTISGNILSNEIRDAIYSGKYNFSENEKKVLLLLLEGYTKSEISKILKFSSHKVENCLGSAYIKAKDLFDNIR